MAVQKPKEVRVLAGTDKDSCFDLSYSEESLGALFLAALAHDLLTPLFISLLLEGQALSFLLLRSLEYRALSFRILTPLIWKTKRSSLLCLKRPFLA